MMNNVWVSSGSTTVEAMVNPIAAACAGDGLDSKFIPDTVYFLDNPGLGDALSDTKVLTRTLLEQYGVESPTIETGHIDHETDFQGIATHFQDAIAEAHDAAANVAVDVTPGRKFMSVIAFNAGMTYNADHIFYFYLESSDYFSRIYPEIPRTAAKLYDFTEIL
jgi:hypothetical protein